MLSKYGMIRALRASAFQRMRLAQWLRLEALYCEHVEAEAFNEIGERLCERAIAILKQEAGRADDSAP